MRFSIQVKSKTSYDFKTKKNSFKIKFETVFFGNLELKNS